jgi:hypothetical protein
MAAQGMATASITEDGMALVFPSLVAFRCWLDHRRTIRELAQFSDRDLTDLGLVRSDLRGS